eukprot:m.176518 g.176518  ORF g.176518 m.176518 type:complete len:321 (+) comp16801_c0_seq1:244-1206(+)
MADEEPPSSKLGEVKLYKAPNASDTLSRVSLETGLDWARGDPSRRLPCAVAYDISSELVEIVEAHSDLLAGIKVAIWLEASPAHTNALVILELGDALHNVFIDAFNSHIKAQVSQWPADIRWDVRSNMAIPGAQKAPDSCLNQCQRDPGQLVSRSPLLICEFESAHRSIVELRHTLSRYFQDLPSLAYAIGMAFDLNFDPNHPLTFGFAAVVFERDGPDSCRFVRAFSTGSKDVSRHFKDAWTRSIPDCPSVIPPFSNPSHDAVLELPVARLVGNLNPAILDAIQERQFGLLIDFKAVLTNPDLVDELTGILEQRAAGME